uniref:Uncharacterized protein n=1 Tax=Anguilla anguilla TaxID=7936 RepID=A0A0E9S0N4_ANGAN
MRPERQAKTKSHFAWLLLTTQIRMTIRTTCLEEEFSMIFTNGQNDFVDLY